MKSISNVRSTADTYAINTADFVNNYVLVANTAKTVTVPAGAAFASFSPAVPFYANFNGATAVVPSVDITTGLGHEYMPVTRYIAGVATISIISDQAGAVTVSFYNS